MTGERISGHAVTARSSRASTMSRVATWRGARHATASSGSGASANHPGVTPETTLQNGDIIGRRDLWPTFPTHRNDCSGSGPVLAAASLMRTGYFIVGSPVRAPEGLLEALRARACASRLEARSGNRGPANDPQVLRARGELGMTADRQCVRSVNHQADRLAAGTALSDVVVGGGPSRIEVVPWRHPRRGDVGR
jgi:hypothetical protein